MRSRRSPVNPRRLAVLVAPAMLAIPSFVHAQVFTAAPTGDYTVGTNWSPNGVPTAATSVQIRNTTGTTATIGDAETGLALNLSIGNAANSSGTLSLTSSATFTGAGAVTVGQASGSGTLINNGTFSVTGQMVFGMGANSSGTLIMSGGSLNTTSTLLAFGSTGTGTLLQSGGTITLPSTGTFGLGRGSTGYYDMEGGTLIVGGVFQMASGSGGAPTGVGTLILNNGTISGANLVTFAANGNATVTIGGGTLLAAAGMNLSNNAVCTTTLTQTNGYVGTGTLTVGVGSSTGGAAVANWNMSGGTLAVGTTMLVGGTGVSLANGTFTQTGGFLSVGGPLIVGDGSTTVASSGTMNISGTGSVQVATTSTMSVGTTGSGTVLLCATAAGTSSLSAGTIQVGSLLNGANAQNSQFLMGSTSIPGALPTVTAGTINFGLANNSLTTTRLFSMSSGTLNVGVVDLTSYNAQDFLNNTQATFQQLGGTLNAGSMTFAGGIYQVGNATVAPTVTNKAAIFVNQAGTISLPVGIGNGSSTFSGGGTIAVNGALTLNGALVNNGAQLNIGSTVSYVGGTVTFRGAETNAVGSGIKVVSGQLNMQADGGLVGGVANLALTVSDHATIGGGTFANATENLGTLSILGGGVVRLNSTTPGAMPNILLHTGTLAIKNDAVPTGTLDVAANDAIVDNGNFSIIRSQVISGRSGGTWVGPGIRSSAAAAKPTVAGIGYANVSDIGTTTFDGVTGLSPSAVLLKYTLLGDANLDGVVNALDFNALATNYGNTTGAANWVQGDYTYDGTVNSDDFGALAANFGGNVVASGADLPDAAPAASLGTLVPEPMSVSLMLMSSVALMQRRRRA